MNPFTFQTCPNIVFETGAAAKIAEIVGSYDAKRVMLVTDEGVRIEHFRQKRSLGLGRST